MNPNQYLLLQLQTCVVYFPNGGLRYPGLLPRPSSQYIYRGISYRRTLSDWLVYLLRASLAATAFLHSSLASHPELPRTRSLVLVKVVVSASWYSQHSTVANNQNHFHLEIGNHREVSLFGQNDLYEEHRSLVPGVDRFFAIPTFHRQM